MPSWVKSAPLVIVSLFYLASLGRVLGGRLAEEDNRGNQLLNALAGRFARSSV